MITPTALMDDVELSNVWTEPAMEILSAEPFQEFFPGLGIRIQVSLDRRYGRKVRVTVENNLLQAGFDPLQWTDPTCSPLSNELTGESRQRICNQLQVAAMSLDILQSQPKEWNDNLTPNLKMAIESLTELDRLVVDTSLPVWSKTDH